jgi:hypothetical protein
VFWGAIAFLTLYITLYVVFEPPLEVVVSVELVLLSGVYAAVGGRHAVQAWRIRQAVRVLRTFDVQGRQAILNSLDDERAKAYFEFRLVDHGSPEATGLVERFAFSPVDIREVTVLTWVTACCAGGLLISAFAFGLSEPTRAGSLAGGVGLAGLVLILSRKSARMGRTFEVSPFGLSEIASNGSIRRLLWGYGLTLRNRPWLRRIELSPAGELDYIAIPYTVVGFERIAELILRKGGFCDKAA